MERGGLERGVHPGHGPGSLSPQAARGLVPPKLPWKYEIKAKLKAVAYEEWNVENLHHLALASKNVSVMATMENGLKNGCFLWTLCTEQ